MSGVLHERVEIEHPWLPTSLRSERAPIVADPAPVSRPETDEDAQGGGIAVEDFQVVRPTDIPS